MTVASHDATGLPIRRRPTAAGASAVVVVAGGLLSLNRFGGLALTTPRAFSRLALVVVWGWVGLAVVAWVGASIAGHRRSSTLPSDALATTGRAHLPFVALSIVLFVAAGALQLRWPGLIGAVAVLGGWFPARLARGLRDDLEMSTPAVAVTLFVGYGLWIATIGRHLHTQLGHLI